MDYSDFDLFDRALKLAEVFKSREFAQNFIELANEDWPSSDSSSCESNYMRHLYQFLGTPADQASIKFALKILESRDSIMGLFAENKLEESKRLLSEITAYSLMLGALVLRTALPEARKNQAKTANAARRGIADIVMPLAEAYWRKFPSFRGNVNGTAVKISGDVESEAVLAGLKNWPAKKEVMIGRIRGCIRRELAESK